MPYCRNNQEANVLVSNDYGTTWGSPIALPVPSEWSWIATGPPGSLALNSGRILIPANHITMSAPASHVYISDDGGAHWSISTAVADGNEDQAVALPWLSANSVLLSMRAGNGPTRLAALSSDGGATWGAAWPTIAETQCEASTIALPAHPSGPRLIMSSAFSSVRQNMTLSASDDDGRTWRAETLVYAGSSAYSSLVAVAPAQIALAFERDAYMHISFVAPINV